METLAGVLAGGQTGAVQNTVRENSLLSQEEFFDIMIAELTHQDPLEPMDNREFLSQLTQLQSLDVLSRLADGIESLILGQQISSAGALIGRDVSGVTNGGTLVTGTVERVIVEDGVVFLGIGDATLPLANVHEVTDSQESE